MLLPSRDPPIYIAFNVACTVKFPFCRTSILILRYLLENTLMYTIVIYKLLFNYHAYNDDRMDLTQYILTKIFHTSEP